MPMMMMAVNKKAIIPLAILKKNLATTKARTTTTNSTIHDNTSDITASLFILQRFILTAHYII
jgi:hypothetical protein